MKASVIRKISNIGHKSPILVIPACFQPFLNWKSTRTYVRVTLDGKKLIIEETNERNKINSRKSRLLNGLHLSEKAIITQQG